MSRDAFSKHNPLPLFDQPIGTRKPPRAMAKLKPDGYVPARRGQSASEDAAHVHAGKFDTIRRNVLRGVLQHPERTALELASLIGTDRNTVRSRLTELKEAKLVKKSKERRACDVSHSNVHTWSITQAGIDALSQAVRE